MPNVEPLREGDPATVGPYRLVGRLGAGGHGVVYLGQARNGTPVAVKVLREGLAVGDRLATEIAAARKVEPFCLAQVLDASTSGRPYVVSEYVDGPSLEQVGRLGGAELQRLAVATATALDAIHQAGVVHGDFKPANVLIGPDGPRVVDFGIAGALGTGVKATGSFVGTPAYMAPEQLSGKAAGAAADVFAWGSVMVCAATGAPPFGDDSLPAVINRILQDEPRMGELRGPVREILLACLAKDPGSRPAMRDVLLRLAAPSRQQTAPYQSPPHRPDPPLESWQDTPEATLDQDTPPRRARPQEPAAEQPLAPLPRRNARQTHGADPQSLGRPVAGRPVDQPTGQPVGQPVGQAAPAADHGQGPHVGQGAPAHFEGPAARQSPAPHYDQGPVAHHQGATAQHGQGPGTFPMAAPVEAPAAAGFPHHAPAEARPGFPPVEAPGYPPMEAQGFPNAERPGAEHVAPEPAVAQHSALVDLLVPGEPAPQAPPEAPAPPPRPGRRRVKTVLIAGVAGVSVLALAGAIMWLTPTTPTPKAKNVADASTAPTTGTATTPTTRPKRTRTPRPSPQNDGTPSNVPTADPTTDPTGDATPGVDRLRLVYVRPGGARNGNCWTGGEVTLQALVQRTGQPLNFAYTWYIDNAAVGRSSALITANGRRVLTSPQNLRSTGGVHRVTLRITSPVATQRTISVTMCDRGTY
ncbi:serine/threonine protein kinase [Nonomuraea sp. NPDC050153]|uniref:serine/threonine protein kinase n=1 Tax=Nonomuraea sp. NPDC050153 TaxID=3364359 RepID=UPI0037B74461